MVDGSVLKLQLHDLSLINGLLYLKLEIGYVTVGNILSYNTLMSIYIPRYWVRGQCCLMSLGSFALGWQTQMGRPLCGERGEKRWLDTQLEKIMDIPSGASSYLSIHSGNTFHPFGH